MRFRRVDSLLQSLDMSGGGCDEKKQSDRVANAAGRRPVPDLRRAWLVVGRDPARSSREARFGSRLRGRGGFNILGDLPGQRPVWPADRISADRDVGCYRL